MPSAMHDASGTCINRRGKRWGKIHVYVSLPRLMNMYPFSFECFNFLWNKMSDRIKFIDCCKSDFITIIKHFLTKKITILINKLFRKFDKWTKHLLIKTNASFFKEVSFFLMKTKTKRALNFEWHFTNITASRLVPALKQLDIIITKEMLYDAVREKAWQSYHHLHELIHRLSSNAIEGPAPLHRQMQKGYKT